MKNILKNRYFNESQLNIIKQLDDVIKGLDILLMHYVHPFVKFIYMKYLRIW